MATMNESELSRLKRPELQKLAKTNGIKANRKNADIIKDLLIKEHFRTTSAPNAVTPLGPSCQIGKENLANIPDVNKTVTQVSFNHEIKTVEDVDTEITIKKVPVTKIPKFLGAALKVDNPKSATKKFERIHSKRFNRMESIDDYIKKKTQRANGLKSSLKTVTNDVLGVLSNFKKSHNTPKTPKAGFTPMANITPKVSFTPKSKKSIGTTVAPANLSNVKPKVDSWHKERTVSRKTVFDFRSPLKKLDLPPKKTTNKFDLKESLKKPLSYKPHRGRLLTLEKTYVNKENAAEPRQRDVKSMRRTQVHTREQRKMDVKANRNNAKQKLLDKRRGITVS